MKSDQINELASALSKAQGEMRSASKDGLNPHRKSKYATLESVWDACRDPLSKNGLSVSQIICQEGDSVFLTTMLMHNSGQWIKSVMPLVSGKVGPQEIGAALTYMRRYSLTAIVGVTVDEDDDGEKAQKDHVTATEATISQQQVAEILRLIDNEAGMIQKICTVEGVEKLVDISVKKFPTVIRNLRTLKEVS